MAIQKVKDTLTLIQTAGDVYEGNGADQIYTLTPTLVDSGDTITIIDQGGSNRIELAGGLVISNALIANDEALLTLSNGASVNIRGADTFTYFSGANTGAGQSGVSHSFTSFVTSVLQMSMPATGVASASSSVQVNSDGSSVVLDQAPPEYTLQASTQAVTEGNSVTFTLTTANLPASITEVPYTLSGISGADIDGAPLQGSFQLLSNGSSSLTLTLTDDQLAETESLILTLDGVSGTAPVTVTINDGATAPDPGPVTPAPTGDGNSISADGLPSTDYRYANEATTDSLLSGSMWGNGIGQGVTLTYSFPQTGAVWAADYGNYNEPAHGFQALTTVQQQAARDALALWADVANVTFTEITESGGEVGDIRFGFSHEVIGVTAAWAYLPAGFANAPSASSGDVWFNPNNYNDTDWQSGSKNFHTMVHELGHSLGLKHSFDADGNGTVLSGDQESMKYTTMSYTPHADMGNAYTDIGDGVFSYLPTPPATPLLYDIKAMQFMYGANYDTRTGDDIYSFSDTAAFIEAIWDAGGTDTIDASNQNFGVTIKLTAGELSSIGSRYLDLNTPSAAVENLAIAFGVEIENAIGSAKGDTLMGNSLNNQLTGGKGNDLLYGGAGIDTAIFNGNRDDYQIFTDTGSGLGTEVIGADGADQLTEIELIQFNDQTVELALLS